MLEQRQNPRLEDVESDKVEDGNDQASSASGTTGAAQQEKREEDDGADLRGIPHATTVWQAAIEDFSPMWYTISMSSGILGSIMARFPYRFKGLLILTDIIYLIDLVTFILITSVMVARFTMFPRAALRKTAKDYEEICFWACAPLALLTIAALTGSQVSNAYWGGHAFSLVAYVLWWVGAAWIMLAAVGIFISLFRLDLVNDRSLTTAIFLPAVGIATAATEAGFIANYAYDVSARLAVPSLIMGYFLVGFAVFLAILSYTIFLHRLLTSGWPPPEKIPAMCLLLGPFGQSATALVLLGTAASKKADFPHYSSNSAPPTFFQSTSASSLASASTFLSLLLLGFEYFWALVALFSILEAALSRKLPPSYSLIWWSTIFPVGTLCTAWLVLGSEMDSPAFRALTVGLFLLLLVDYIVNFVYTVKGIFWGKLFFKRGKEEMEAEGSKME